MAGPGGGRDAASSGRWPPSGWVPTGYAIGRFRVGRSGICTGRATLFVLASLGEGLPRVLIEAMAQGLPCLAHDYDVTRYVSGAHGGLADLSQAGSLTRAAERGARTLPRSQSARERHRFAYESFSWDRLRPAYVRLLPSGRPGALRPAKPDRLARSSGELRLLDEATR